MGFTNSSLITYKKISPNKTANRTHAIDTITIHCLVGQWTAKQGCDYFAKSSSKASCNYVVGKDGSIGLCVEEKDRSWCSSNAVNDHRAVTIEVASDTTAPYAVTDKALSTLIKLCADICKRNGIKELKWKGDKSLIGKVDQQNMTVHRWFAAKSCPGDYLYNKHGYIAKEVNKILNASANTSTSSSSYDTYKVQKGDTLSKIGSKTGIPWKTIAELNGIKFPYILKAGQILKLKESTTSTATFTVKLKDDLNIRKSPNGEIVKYNGAKKGQVYTIVEVDGNWGLLKSYQKTRNGWISISDKYVIRL